MMLYSISTKISLENHLRVPIRSLISSTFAFNFSKQKIDHYKAKLIFNNSQLKTMPALQRVVMFTSHIIRFCNAQINPSQVTWMGPKMPNTQHAFVFSTSSFNVPPKNHGTKVLSSLNSFNF